MTAKKVGLDYVRNIWKGYTQSSRVDFYAKQIHELVQEHPGAPFIDALTFRRDLHDAMKLKDGGSIKADHKGKISGVVSGSRSGGGGGGGGGSSGCKKEALHDAATRLQALLLAQTGTPASQQQQQQQRPRSAYLPILLAAMLHELAKMAAAAAAAVGTAVGNDEGVYWEKLSKMSDLLPGGEGGRSGGALSPDHWSDPLDEILDLNSKYAWEKQVGGRRVCPCCRHVCPRASPCVPSRPPVRQL